MIATRKVGPEAFDEIHSELLVTLDAERPKEEWRRIFTREWDSDRDYNGYALLDDGQIVGFLGLIFALMPTPAGAEPLCNVTSWIVKESYRGEAALLVLPLRKLTGHTLTNLSCNRVAYQVFTRLGFDVLETHKRIFLPPPPGFGRPRPRAAIILEPEEIARRLDGRDAKLFQHHRTCAHHLLIEEADGYCYTIFTSGRRRRLPCARIHYLSNRARLPSLLSTIQSSLWKHHGLVLAECDERLVEGLELARSFRTRLPIPRLFRSSRLSKHQITNLYSEIVLLNLG